MTKFKFSIGDVVTNIEPEIKNEDIGVIVDIKLSGSYSVYYVDWIKERKGLPVFPKKWSLNVLKKASPN